MNLINIFLEVLKEGKRPFDDFGAIKDLFNTHPELAKVGTIDLYSDYLDTIFPNSKIKDIVYHSSIFKDAIYKDNSFKGYVVYFSTSKDYAESIKFKGNVVYAVIDVKSPYKAPKPLYDVPDEVDALGHYTDPRRIKSQIKGHDSVMGKDSGQKEGTSIAVFDPKQIHILGNKQDIEKFRSFVPKNFDPNKEKSSPSKDLSNIRSLFNITKDLLKK
jgi:hypothetical protein